VFGASLEAGRTAATTTLIVLGLSFVLLLERGPGREHIAIQSYMLAMVLGLAGLFAGILALPLARDFFEMELLNASQWFLSLLSAAVGLTIASAFWRLPQIERLERPLEAGETAEGLTPLDIEDEQDQPGDSR
jgi:H+/Cl- antiporter ClcA